MNNKNDKNGKKMTALVADDSVLLCNLLKESLLELGFSQVIVANDGAQAVTAYKNNSIDITFLDLEMPKIDGIGALKEIRALDADAYVVIVSGTGTANSVKKAIILGAKGFIVKPCSPGKISEAVDKFYEASADHRFSE